MIDRPARIPRPRLIRIIESPSAARRLDEARRYMRGFAPDCERMIVSASRGAADDFARELAVEAGATWGLHRFSFTQLAARRAAAALARDGISPGTTLAGEAVAARAAFDAVRDGALDYFRPVADTPGFARALARTLRELRLAGVDASRLSGLRAAGPDLAALLDRVDAQFAAASSADRARLFRTAAEEILRNRSDYADLPILLLDVPIESEAEREFIAALTSAASAALITIPAGDMVTRRALEAVALIEQLDDDSSDLGRLRQYLFAETVPVAPRSSESVRMFSAPGEARECVEIVRRIVEEARSGTPFDRMAVLLRSPQHYLGLLEHACARAGVPAYFDRGTKRPDPAGRAFMALLACANEGLSAKRFAEYLSLAQVPASPRAQVAAPFVAATDEALGILAATTADGAEGGEPESAAAIAEDDPDRAVVSGTLRAPWKWEQLIVDAAVLGGHDRWQRRLDGLAGEYRIKLHALEADDPDSPRVVRLKRDLENLAHLRAFVLPVIDTLAAWPARATWGEWLSQLTAAAPIVLKQPAHVLQVLADLRPMAAVGPATLQEVCDVLNARLLTLEEAPPSRRYGRVFVGSPHQARGRTFDVVFVPGLAERVFPQKAREDPMLLDELREALDPSLPRRAERTLTERLLLRLAIGAATRRVYVSYPRIDAAESRPRVPSFYMLDLWRAQTGRVPSADELGAEAAREARSRLAWPAPDEPDAAIDDLEHDLATLYPLLHNPNVKAVKGHAHYLLGLNDCLRRSLVERWARAERRWSPADGLMRVTDATRPALDAARLTARAYSLSALQRFAACPYQFLLSAIYRLEPLEEPVPLQQMDPLTRGSLFHEVQARFFRTLETRGLLPLSPDRLSAALLTLDQAIEHVALAYYEELAPAIDRTWRDEIADLQKDLRQWVRRMAEHDRNWHPAHFEFGFGLAADGDHDPGSVPGPVSIADRFALRGSVDLIERRADGALRVTDHKTGKNRSTRGMIVGGGASLQPVLYSMVVEKALGRRVVEGRLSYCTAAGGFSVHTIPIDDSARRLGVEVLEIVDRAVENGSLAPAPAERACDYCDFRPVCGPHEERRIARKAPERLRDLVELRSRP